MMMSRINLEYLKLKNLYEKYKRSLWTGTTVWIGIFFIAFGIFFMTTGGRDTTTFAGNEMKPAEGMKLIRSDFTSQSEFTLILYRTNCPACHKAEKNLIANLNKSKTKAKHDYIVLDVEKLNSDQKNELIRLMPDITVRKNHIPTPLVANVKPTSYNKSVLLDVSKTDNEQNYVRVLKNSTKLEAKL